MKDDQVALGALLSLLLSPLPRHQRLIVSLNFSGKVLRNSFKIIREAQLLVKNHIMGQISTAY